MCQFLMISGNQLGFGMLLFTLRTQPSQDRVSLVFPGAHFHLPTPTFPGLSHRSPSIANPTKQMEQGHVLLRAFFLATVS